MLAFGLLRIATSRLFQYRSSIGIMSFIFGQKIDSRMQRRTVATELMKKSFSPGQRLVRHKTDKKKV